MINTFRQFGVELSSILVEGKKSKVFDAEYGGNHAVVKVAQPGYEGWILNEQTMLERLKDVPGTIDVLVQGEAAVDDIDLPFMVLPYARNLTASLGDIVIHDFSRTYPRWHRP